MDETASNNSSQNWKFSNKIYSKDLIKFISQTILLYIIICVSVLNLSLKNGDSNVWISLLSFSLGVIQNAPKLSRKSANPNYINQSSV